MTRGLARNISYSRSRKANVDATSRALPNVPRMAHPYEKLAQPAVALCHLEEFPPPSHHQTRVLLRDPPRRQCHDLIWLSISECRSEMEKTERRIVYYVVPGPWQFRETQAVRLSLFFSKAPSN